MSLQPLISVIIPSYNHARYLPEAVNSVRQQTYKQIEIIVVDDGSTDNTKEAARANDINYVYQYNQGLSAARNTGVEHSNGEYIVFLDADDYLYPDAIETNLKYLMQNPSWAFVSGWHDKVDERRHPIEQDELMVVNANHYINLLQGNYIGMHATVMYRRSILEEFKFNSSLKACEDYDLYLRIARKYPVGSHDKKMAAYRIHGNNMSSKISFMLKSVLTVQRAQKPFLKNKEEEQAWAKGQKVWKDYYLKKLSRSLNRKITKMKQVPYWRERNILFWQRPKEAIKIEARVLKLTLKHALKKLIPAAVLKMLFKRGYYKHYTPAIGDISSGDLERTTPFSSEFGFDRGGAVDRYYIEKFLLENKEHIKGCVLEIGDNTYTLKYGGGRVSKSDVLHVERANETVTYVGDLADAPNIPSETFDCIILTQTLHLIYNVNAALTTCHRILKKGGVLLLTVPGISHIDKGEWKNYWLWSFTDKSLRRLLAENFGEKKIGIKTYGNVYVATAFLYGMGLTEVRKDFLDIHDEAYQVIVAARAVK